MPEEKEVIIDRKHVMEVIKQGISALKSEDSDKLKALSNQTVHETTCCQDIGSISLIVTLYAISKIIERHAQQRIKAWASMKTRIIDLLAKSIKSLQEKRDIEFAKNMTQARTILVSNSGNMKSYMEEILKKASLNKASKLYEHGVSLGQTSKLLGVNRWDLNQYSSSSHQTDETYNKSLTAKARATMASDFFANGDKKVLIFDAGALINLSMNGLLYILPALKAKFKGKFIITHSVKEEVIDRPMKVQRFELGALRIQKLLEDKVLEMAETLDISHAQIEGETIKLVEKINHFIQANDRWIKIVSPGEISCLALSNELEKKGFGSIIAIDERTTRLLSEKPENLEKLMSRKLHMQA
jgi:hypothetical protein